MQCKEQLVTKTVGFVLAISASEGVAFVGLCGLWSSEDVSPELGNSLFLSIFPGVSIWQRVVTTRVQEVNVPDDPRLDHTHDPAHCFNTSVFVQVQLPKINMFTVAHKIG